MTLSYWMSYSPFENCTKPKLFRLTDDVEIVPDPFYEHTFNWRTLELCIDSIKGTLDNEEAQELVYDKKPKNIVIHKIYIDAIDYEMDRVTVFYETGDIAYFEPEIEGEDEEDEEEDEEEEDEFDY